MSKFRLAIALALTLTSYQLLSADTIDVCIVGYYKKGDIILIKNGDNKTIYSCESSYTGNHRWELKYFIADSIPEYSYLPIKIFYAKAHHKPRQLNLGFIKQNDRKFLLIERFPLYKDNFSFRVIWLDRYRTEFLLPEYSKTM